MTELKLEKETKARLAGQIRRYVEEELDIEIGNLQADLMIDFLTPSLGASFYNLGLKDAQALIAGKMEDLNDDFYALERTEDPIR